MTCEKSGDLLMQKIKRIEVYTTTENSEDFLLWKNLLIISLGKKEVLIFQQYKEYDRKIYENGFCGTL